MKRNELSNENHVIHYVRPRYMLSDGTIDGSQFKLRINDIDGLSVNWLEYFSNYIKCDQIKKIKSSINLKIQKNSGFAEFNVGDTKSTFYKEGEKLNFIHAPIIKSNNHNADPSHSLVIGLPAYGSPKSAEIGDLLAKCIKTIHRN